MHDFLGIGRSIPPDLQELRMPEVMMCQLVKRYEANGQSCKNKR
jgi:hypothetical protein